MHPFAILYLEKIIIGIILSLANNKILLRMKIFLQLLLILSPIISLSQNTNGSADNGTVNGLIDNFGIKLFSIQAGGNKVETDGARAKFGPAYCACIDADDAFKFMGSGIENISLLRNGASLVIEARPYITATDTLFLLMEGMNIGGSYEFQIAPINFDTSVAMCKLHDNFLNRDTVISLSDTSTIAFNVSAAIGSDATDRFSIIFYPATIVPVNTIYASAFKQNNNVVIGWENTKETDVKLYTVEKSIDGAKFYTIHNSEAKNNAQKNMYSYYDMYPAETNNFYRIKTTKLSGSKLYSNILAINFESKTTNQLSVYPNPVKGKTIGLQLNNFIEGRYFVKLFNTLGQLVYSNTIQNTGSSSSISLQLNNSIAPGNYTIQLTEVNGKAISKNIVIE